MRILVPLWRPWLTEEWGDTMTSNAPMASSDPPGANATGRTFRQLWQVPLFLLSLALLLAGWMSYRCRGRCLSWELGKEINSARHLLQKPDGNLDHAVDLLERVLQQGEEVPTRLGEVHFLLGTAQLRQADRAEPAQAAALYRSGRQHLEEAERRGVPEADRGTLLYRLAKAAFHTGEDPEKVVQMLGSTIDKAEDREKADACVLLTEANLRLPTPNYRAALAANEKLRKDVAYVPEEVLGPARLKGGELLIKLGRFDEAQKALSRLVNMGPLIPKSILVRARLLLAQTCENGSNWPEAIGHWRAALADVPDSAPSIA